ncbi:MAG: AsmA-like C-terminal region-containing protein, partial [Phycisphaerae bacterium]
SIRQMLPSVYRRFLDRFQLAGRFRVQHLDYGDSPNDRRRLQLEFRNVSGVMPLPLRPDDAAAADSESYIPLAADGLSGEILLSENELDLTLQGRINGAPCEFSGRIEGVDRPFAEVGLDLRLSCEGFEFPDAAMQARIQQDQTVPSRLRYFLQDFAPRGVADLELRLARASGPGRGVQLTGELRARGVAATFRSIAYPLEDLRGVVKFNSDAIRLVDLTGRHGSAAVRVEGDIEHPYWWTDVQLDITGRAAPFDATLFGVLPQSYQNIWRRLGLRGWGDVRLSLRREGGDADAGPADWEIGATIDLSDAFARFDAFPFDLSHVRGRIQITGDRIDFQDITARHDRASIRIDGRADWSADAESVVELRLEADDLALDADLAAAMPGDVHDTLRAFGLKGYADLVGRVYLRRDADGVAYDLAGRLHHGELCLREIPVPIRDVRGRFRLTPDRMELDAIRGRYHDADVRIDGAINRGGDGHTADITVQAERVALDDELFRALPAGLRELWRMFQPRGVVDLTSHIRETIAGGRVKRAHRTELRMNGGGICFSGLPLPLEQVDAHVILSDDRSDILQLRGWPTLPMDDPNETGQSGGSVCRVSLSGSVRRRGGAWRSDLRLDATDIPLAHAQLQAALPDALGTLISQMRPRGVVDIRSTLISIAGGESDPSQWRLDGAVRLRDVSLNLGMQLDGAVGEFAGVVELHDGELTRLIGSAALESVVIDEWPLTSAQADFRLAPGSQTLHIDNLSAGYFGGRLTGFARINLGRPKTTYGLSLSLTDADLGAYLASRRKPASAPSEARGRVDANLSMTGTSGDPASREGGGEIYLRDGQVWKLPLFLAVLRVLHFSPDDNAFEEGRIRYFVFGDRLRLARVELRGRSVMLLGSGDMDLRTGVLDVRLIAGAPDHLRVPLLTELLEGATRELLQIRVRGTLDSPKITSEPLRGIQDILTDLFGPDAGARAF